MTNTVGYWFVKFFMFLNHLCDDERDTAQTKAVEAFLNHLCDDE